MLGHMGYVGVSSLFNSILSIFGHSGVFTNLVYYVSLLIDGLVSHWAGQQTHGLLKDIGFEH
jgi:hypothetical protein